MPKLVKLLPDNFMNAEQSRLNDHYTKKINWLKWGPYVSERQWGTVREDYSANGDAWNYLSHDMARSKAYRWGEDGLGGFSDDHQHLCMSLALWNGQDSILKERLFGLTNGEGNHGEDVKELYYYLDATPSHSYQKLLYKYPQQSFPYEQLIKNNHQRSKKEPEYELIDTGVFEDNHYFDVFIEYFKNEPEDILACYTVYNRSTQPALLHLIPQLWFRNTWSWNEETTKPEITYMGNNTLILQSKELGDYYCYLDGQPKLLFTENETNHQRLYRTPNNSLYVKDGFNEHIVQNNTQAINPLLHGTKVAAWYQAEVPAGGCFQVKLRLTPQPKSDPFSGFDQIKADRMKEADVFYAAKQAADADEDEQLIMRQAWAGLLWSKQFYFYNINQWLTGDPEVHTPPVGHATGRNHRWVHFRAADIILMPDKWEYPWFAAWDLAFHCIAFGSIDPDFAKNQLCLLVKANYMHPNGQLPAYEWDFNDVNPPVHAMAAWRVFNLDRHQTGTPDYVFLEEIFQKLLLNFTWWVNQKDREGNNIFEGGFLGLDNIGIFNRSAPVPGGGHLEQADGSSWMAMYALNMTQIAMELSLQNPIYEEMAVKFSEHFLYIAGSIMQIGKDSLGLWDEEEGFYFDLLRKPDGSYDRLKLRSLVGLIPMFATIVFDEAKWRNLPYLKERLDSLKKERPDLAALVSRWKDTNGDEQHLLSLLRGHRMKRLLRRMLDPNEFLSDYGIRSLSKVYDKHPYAYWFNGEDFSVQYTPGESDTNMFGGNSNWRGPIWIPINYLLIQSLYTFQDYYTAEFRVEYPTHSGNFYSLAEIANALSARITNIFRRNEKGERPVFGGNIKFNQDPHFKDYILFYEYFHGDTGSGLGASHQTGWTALLTVLR